MTTNVRTQSIITNGQIGQINDRLATKLRESGLLVENVQRVLKMPGNAAIDEMVAVFCRHVKAHSNIIVRHAKVNRSRTPQEVLDATGRQQYVDKDVLATIPTGEGDEVDVYFVPTNRRVSAKEVPAFLAQYNLVPDPRAQAAVNEEDPAFADKYPNGTQWGDNCYLAFDRWVDDERYVRCRRSGRDWSDRWLLAGVPASRK